MENVFFGFDDSSTYDQKQTNPRNSSLAIQRCNKYLIHACQCIGANCSVPRCQKMKRVLQHAKRCILKKEGGCPICKQFASLCCYHAKHCQVPKCSVHSCDNIKTKLKLQQLQKRLHQAQILEKRIAIMNMNRLIDCPAVQTSLGTSNSTNTPSPGAQLHSSQPDIGRKPATVVSPPTANAGLMLTTQQMPAQMQNPMSQMMSGVPNGMLNMSNVAGLEDSGYAQNPQPHQNPQPQSASQMGLRQQTHLVGGPGNMPNTIGNSSMGPPQVMPNPAASLGGMQGSIQAWQKLLQILRSPPSAQQQEQVLAILKSDPKLMAAFIKHRTAQKKQQEQLKHQELQQSLSSTNDLLACKVCMDRERNAVFQPCGHFVSCWDCSNSLSNCPICRKPVTHKIRTYFC